MRTTPRKSLIFKSVFLCALAMAGALGQSAQAAAPIQQQTLSNGQTLYIQENHTRPIVTIDSWVKTGSVNETDKNNGVSHFLEHLLFKGTPTHPAGTIDRLLESHGATFNAATSDDYTHYYITLPSNYFADALKLHADMLLNASIPPAELDQERKVVQEEINRADDTPERKLYIALQERLYKGHGYAYDTLGPKSNIASIPRQNILDYYHHWYQPQNLNTVITGDVSAPEVIKAVEQAFVSSNNNPSPLGRGWSAGPGEGTPKVPTFPLTPQVLIQTDPSVSQAYVMLGLPGPAMAARQDVLAMDAAMAILGQGDSSRLVKRLREDQPLASSIGSGNQTQREAGILYVSAELKPENLAKVRAEMINALQTLRDKGVTTDELEKFKTQTVKSFLFQNESTESVATNVGYNVTIGKLSDYTDYVSDVQALTVPQVNAAAQRLINLNQAVWVGLLPPADKTAKGKAPVNLAAEISLTTEALKAAGKPVAPKATPQTVAIEAPVLSKVRKERLANGLTLISKPNSTTDTVAIQIFGRGGQALEPVPGLADLMANTLMQGTTHRSAAALKRELESQGINLSTSAGEDVLQITASAAKTDMGALMNLLQDVLQHPAFLQAELDKQKQLMAQAIVGAQDNPATVVSQQLTQALYPKHPYGNVGDRVLKALPGISRAQVLNYYQASLSPKNVVVSAVGNFDPQILKSALLAAFPANGGKPLGAPPLVKPLDKAERLVLEKSNKATGKGATWLTQGWHAPALGQPDQVTLKVLSSLLGNGLSSRLFVDLREKQGLAYTVASQYPSTHQTGRFVLFIGTDPKNQAKVETGFKQEIDRLKKELVPEEELKAAKDKLTGQFALAHETNAEQAYYLGFYEALGAGYGYDVTYPQQAQKVTPADIQRVARLIFDKPAVVSIVKPKG